MRKVFVFLLLLFFILSVKNIYAFTVLPSPGSCGVGTDSATVDISKPENEKYRCCYSDIEQLAEIFKNPLEGAPSPLDKFGGIVGWITNDLIGNFPFIIWLLPGERPITLKGFLTGIKNYISLKRCEANATPIGTPGSDCFCKLNNPSNLASLRPFCDLVNEKERQSCYQCIGYDPRTNSFGAGGVYTAIGCIPNSLSLFIKERVFGWGVGLAGIISLFCIIYAAFQIQTSSGNAEKVKKAQELLTSCIMGLMLIIFSVFILRLIGVDILKIPGFSK